MSTKNKAIQSQQEQQHYRLSQSQANTVNSSPKLYFRTQKQKRQIQTQNNIGVAILMVFLVICVAIFTFRYLQLRERQYEKSFVKEQTQSSYKLLKDSDQLNKNQLQKDAQYSKTQKSYKSQKIEQQSPQNPMLQQKKFQEHHQQSVLQDIDEAQQNSMQLQVKTQSQELLAEIDETDQQEYQDEGYIDNHQISQQLNGAKSVEEAQLLNQKQDLKQNSNQQQTRSVDQEQFYLHPKIHQQKTPQSQQQINFQQKVDSTNFKQTITSTPTSQQNQQNLEKQSQETSEKQNDRKNENSQNTPEINVQQSQGQIKPQQINTQIKQQKFISQTKKWSQKDLSDPIIRVKDKMQHNLNAKFQDLIFIKAGTNVTQPQYYNARQRMNVWKYFNPSTNSLQLLDQVNYDPQISANSQSAQRQIEKIQKIILQEKLQYEKKYQVSQYNQIPFCLIIPSYKNQDKYFRNLNSILQQDYSNYHIIYIDDASHDGTAQKVKSYIQKYQIPSTKLNFIQNEVNKKALPNIDYAARRLCNSGQIMAIIDGDDYLIGTQVFKLINARYQKESLLALYTNHLRVHQPIYLKVGTCIDYPERVKKTRSYRRFSIFPASHLRTFFVDLYWRINLRDLKDYRGEYFTAANDFAIMMPILQMAGQRFEYLPELTYVYDAGTGFNNFQTKADTQAKNFKITKRRHKYPKLVHDLQFQKHLQQKGLMKIQSERKPKTK